MNRSAIVAAAARRLGEESAAFLAIVDAEFPFVIHDLAAHQALGLLTGKATCTWTASTRSYDVHSLLGLIDLGLTQNEVWDIESVVVYAWGPTQGIISRANTEREFMQQRLTDGDTTEGRPTLWRFYPTRSTIEFHPIPDAEAASASVEITYIAEPTIPLGPYEVSQVRTEDQEVVVWGLMARLAPFKEDYANDADKWWQLYLAGIERMKANRFNSCPGRIEPMDL
jgi:hypothetical protein